MHARESHDSSVPKNWVAVVVLRQNLDNFTNNANVIQFTSAEFTGPLHFMQFWLDTVSAWENQHPVQKPLIALSCTKDVQDAILSDSERRATVDVIDFRYWWQENLLC